MTNWLIGLLKTPKTQIGFLLAFIFITAFFNNPSLKVILVFTLSVGSTLFFDLLFVKLRRIKPFFPSASLVTGSIIGLLTAPNLAWYVPVMVGIIAMFSKNFLRFSNRHVFNPAAFGLLGGALLFSTPVSWWAVSWQQFRLHNSDFIIYFLILLTPGLISLYRMRRYRITGTFLLAYILINKIFNFQLSTFNLILDPTVLFFSIVMLPEPLTSPNRKTRQIMFGVFIALTSVLMSSPISNFKFQISNFVLDPLIFSLLLGNLVFFRFR